MRGIDPATIAHFTRVACDGHDHAVWIDRRGRLHMPDHVPGYASVVDAQVMANVKPDGCGQVLLRLRGPKVGVLPPRALGDAFGEADKRRDDRKRARQFLDPLTRPRTAVSARARIEVLTETAMCATMESTHRYRNRYEVSRGKRPEVSIEIASTDRVAAPKMITKTRRNHETGRAYDGTGMHIVLPPRWYWDVYRKGRALTHDGWLVLSVDEHGAAAYVVETMRKDWAGHEERAVEIKIRARAKFSSKKDGELC